MLDPAAQLRLRSNSNRTYLRRVWPITKRGFPLHLILWLCGKAPGNTMSITHIVLFQFKPGLDAQVIKDVWFVEAVTSRTQLTRPQVCTRMLGLKDNCLHPSSSKPYIKSSSGGADNSPEGIQVRSRLQRFLLVHKSEAFSMLYNDDVFWQYDSV